MFESSTPIALPDGPIWAVAANVVFEREFGEDHELRSGTKHFRPGAKVHIVNINTFDETAQVVGKQRKSGRIITIWTRLTFLANPRAELVYSPILKRKIAFFRWTYRVDAKGDYFGTEPPFRFVPQHRQREWNGSEQAHEDAEKLVAYLKETMPQQPFLTRLPPDS